MEAREKILRSADQLFNRYGVRSVTMDDIARDLGISKKTIYQYFADKEEMVVEVTRAAVAEQQCEWKAVTDMARDAVHEIILAAEHIEKAFRSMNPNLLYDLRKYHPSAWDLYLEHKDSHFYQQVVDNLRRGIAEGYYRKELNVEVIAKLRMEQVQMGFDPKVFPPDRYPLADVQLQLLDHFIHGIVTLKGYSLVIQYKKEHQGEKIFK